MGRASARSRSIASVAPRSRIPSGPGSPGTATAGSARWRPTSTVVPAEAVFGAEEVERIREQLRQIPPPIDGIESTRWTLTRIMVAAPWLGPRTTSGTWRLLQRHRIRLCRGRPRLFSPDPEYAAKRDHLLSVLTAVAEDPEHSVALFLDEMAYHHWPEPGLTWASRDGPRPRAERAAPGERHKKAIAALNARTGQVTYHQRARMTHDQVCTFLIMLKAEYAEAEHIYAIWDNAPVHHQTLVAECAAWLSIELVFLPTYSPWLNPIEKLWAWVRDAVLRLHRLAGHWDQVPQAVAAFLEHFALGSDALLTRVGLLGDGVLATAVRGVPA
jgi:DDE superfamily endonuclease